MKKLICIAILMISVAAAAFSLNVACAEEGYEVSAFSAYMTDAESGKIGRAHV